MSGWSSWLARPFLWGLPLLFVLVNAGVFAFYRTAYAGQVEVLQRRYESENKIYQELLAERQRLESYLERVTSSSVGMSELYLNVFSTEPERLTRARREIKELARRAGLDPTALSYSRQALSDVHLHRLGIRFGVEGTYEQLRQLINLFELSDQFLILEQVSLNKTGSAGGADPLLSINLSLSTIFTDEELARRAAAETRPAADGGHDGSPPPDVEEDDAAAPDAGGASQEPVAVPQDDEDETTAVEESAGQESTP